MFDTLFDLPLWITGPGLIVMLVFFGVGGLLVVRRYVLPRLRIHIEDSEFSGTMVQTVMVFYGLAVALIAVSVWQTYSDVSSTVSHEAIGIAALYRDVSAYPEPVRSELQSILRDYVHYVIQEAWPLQQRGQIPGGGVERMNQFQKTLIAYEPATESQKLLHGEALRAYNHMIEARRLRLDSVKTGLPGVMWIVIIVGAIIGLSSSFFFKVEDARLHAILVTLLATFMGLVIFMIFALDRPYRGDLGVQPEPYQLIYDQLMKPAGGASTLQSQTPLTSDKP
jgi:hypothetical protein